MLFTADAWPGIRDGSITVTFRRWTRAQAKTGGRYRVGRMLIEAVDVRQVPAASISDADSRASGATGRAEVLARLGHPQPGDSVWRVEFRHLGEDDRIVRRRDDALDAAAIADLRARLGRMDARCPTGPWAMETLRLLAVHPGVVSTELATRVGQDRFVFKANVRKLKELGLTESLAVGYRLSPRGRRLLDAVEAS